VLVQRGGIQVAAIIAPDEYKRFLRSERERSERFKVIEESWAAFKDVDLGDFEAEVAKAVAEAGVEREAAPRGK
jgi:hypothetical protein